ncbi:MAG TPA: hypothetical protein VF196_04675 [Casimicrobiaceae bacterium]
MLLAASAIPAAPVIALMGLGVIIAIAGHATRIRGAVALGLAILFLATAGMILGGFAAYQDDPGDPRKSDPAYPGVPGP